MRAAVLAGVGRLEIRDVPRPNPRADEVLLRVEAVGLCGTDLHIVAGEANYNRDPRGRVIPLAEQPQILGHEIAGVVHDVGAAVRDLAPGDRVVVDQGRNCRSERRSPICEYRATGDAHQCEQYAEHGITGLAGGFAEYLAIPAVNAVRIESGLDAANAALAEPLGCVVHSCDVLSRTPARYTLEGAGDRRIRAVVVCGAGPAGLLFIQYLRKVLGFDGSLIVSEPSPCKRALAARFGADAIDPAVEDLADAVHARTGGRRAELLIEASGAGSVFATIPTLVRKQATLVLYGHGHGGAALSALNGVQFMEPTLVAATGASGGFDDDGRPTTYRRALELIEAGTIDVARLITHRYASLDEVPAAFAGDHRAPHYIKGVVLEDSV
jgi:L-iditol 2-dehydrogenase